MKFAASDHIADATQKTLRTLLEIISGFCDFLDSQVSFLHEIAASSSQPCLVRPAQAADLEALMQIQRACYGDGFIEGHEVFARRLASPANCSLVAERAGELLAYLAAYWSTAGKVTPLHGDFESSLAPDTLYLHDMAVHPAHSGQGLAQRLLDALSAQALQRRITHSCLVAVQGAHSYWRRQAYSVHQLHNPQQLKRLASYGDDAVYMQRLLQADSICFCESGDNAGYA